MDFDKILHGVGPHKANLNVCSCHDRMKDDVRVMSQRIWLLC